VQDLKNREFSLEQILAFVRSRTTAEEVNEDSDLFEDLELRGKTFTDFIKAFAQRFQVDISTYTWYFHTDEDEISIGTMFFKPPNERVHRIPVTPSMLLHFANQGYWDVHYPEHEIPSSRLDILINILIVFGVLFLLLYVALRK
jgi:hypothetical protein